MRLKSIDIKEYNQFKELKLDLTYPKGHKKAGESLDKICIIGDNGTGKTTILRLIRDYYWRMQNDFLNSSSISSINSIRIFHNQDASFVWENTQEISKSEFDSYNKLLFFFPTGPDLTSIKAKVQMILFNNYLNKKIYDLNDRETQQTWFVFRNALQESIAKEINYRKELLSKFTDEYDVHKIKAGLTEAAKTLEKFQKENPNNLEKLKDFFDPILRRFHLQIDTSIDLDNLEKQTFLRLKTINDKSIPMENWSTGIRQLIYTLLPLYALNPEKSTIMIDEPERSLYPNTQRRIVDFYTTAFPEAQFIFATHSPILAASFDPWEVIELEFTKEGNVQQKLYYDKEKGRHVDNYFINPKYLRWDSMLEVLFGVEEESNPERVKMLMKLATLKRQIKKTTDKKEKQELWEKYQKIAELLDWKTIGDEEN